MGVVARKSFYIQQERLFASLVELYLLPKILPRTPLTIVLPIDLPIEEVMVLPVVLII